MEPSLSLIAFLLLALLPAAAGAQQPAGEVATPPASTIDTVQVLGRRLPLSAFPGAVDVVEGETLRDGQRQVSLSETLVRVPGVTVLDRQNYAQDLQIQSRGFGARSSFGIRGIRLVVDGVPSSALDGQGQAANFPLGALDRVEVLRGPLALQYGNAAGGAIVGHTDLDSVEDAVRLDGWISDTTSVRGSVRVDGRSDDGERRWRLLGSAFDTDGERPHSAAERYQLSGVGEWSTTPTDQWRLSFNSLVQPSTQDPLGLTREQWRREPHGTAEEATTFNTSKRIDNHQLGLRRDSEYADGRAYWLGGYGIRRDVVQMLSIPSGAQGAPSSSGGVIDVGRSSWGVEAGHRWSGERTALTVGAELGQLDEARRGYENFIGDRLGVRGRLRRDEDNRIRSREVFAIGEFLPADAWSLLGGARHSQLDFSSSDHYQSPGNGDDSGSVDYRETAASLGVARRFGGGEVFASIGRGFETPTATELAYRSDGQSGLNFELQPARTREAELGLRWRFDAAKVALTTYRVEGDDEIVVARSSGGRSSYANAGDTRRQGVELGIEGQIGPQWTYVVAANWVDARFTQGFQTRVVRGGLVDVRTVDAGNRVPGVPVRNGFAELAWHAPDDRFDAALEARAVGRIPVDDLNSDSAPGQANLALRAQWRSQVSGWSAFARVDNLLDRDYAGSVIVNDGNGRFFEPGAGRAITLGVGWNSR